MDASTTLTLEEREILLRAEMRLMLKGMDEAADQLSECRRFVQLTSPAGSSLAVWFVNWFRVKSCSVVQRLPQTWDSVSSKFAPR